MTAGIVPEGEELVAYFDGLDAASGAWVNAAGKVEGVEVSIVLSGGEERVERVPGRVALVSLSGARGGALYAVLAQADASGAKLWGGRLVKARAVDVAFALGGEAKAEPRGGEAPAQGVRDAAAKPPAAGAPAPSGWAALAAHAPDDDEAEEMPRYGDRVDHFVFGLCDVMVVRGDRLKIRDVHGPGRLREIAIGAVRVLPPEVHEGKRVFKLSKRQ